MRRKLNGLLAAAAAAIPLFAPPAAVADGFPWETAVVDSHAFPESFWSDPYGQLERTIRDTVPGCEGFSVLYDSELSAIGSRTTVRGKGTLGAWCDLFASMTRAYCIHAPQGPHFFAIHNFCWQSGRIVLSGRIGNGEEIRSVALFRLTPDGTTKKMDDFVSDKTGNYLALVSVPGDVVTFWDGRQSFKIRTDYTPDPAYYFVYADGRVSQTNRLEKVEWNKQYRMDFAFDASAQDAGFVFEPPKNNRRKPVPIEEDPFALANGDFFSWEPDPSE